MRSRKNFVGRIEAEDERVQDGILGALDFFVRNRVRLQVVDVCYRAPESTQSWLRSWCPWPVADSRDGRSRLRCRHRRSRPDRAWCECLEQAGRKASAERLIENADGIVVGIVARGAQLHHVNVALVHIFFRNQVVAGLRGMELDFLLLSAGRRLWPMLRKPRAAWLPWRQNRSRRRCPG